MTIQILLAALFLAAVLWLGFRAAPETEGAPVRRARIKEATVFGLPPVPVFCAVLALGLILRFILGYNINGFEADISCFKAWAAYTHDYGFNTGTSSSIIPPAISTCSTSSRRSAACSVSINTRRAIRS